MKKKEAVLLKEKKNQKDFSFIERKTRSGFSFEEGKTRRGFTLIELLIVMAILGLLATVGLASFRSSQIKGRDAQRKNDLGQLQRGLEAYYNDKGQYPITTDFPGAGAVWQDTLLSGEAGTLYMKEIPSDPKGFDYTYESDGISYKIFTYLENQQDKDLKRLECVVGLEKDCSAPDYCNYGVSSANVRVCD